MGMERMFSDGAEFGNLLDTNERLKVSQVVHKAFIEVNEEGAEAAAATGREFLIVWNFYVLLFSYFLLFLCFAHTLKPLS